jgi:hypothetical protein
VLMSLFNPHFICELCPFQYRKIAFFMKVVKQKSRLGLPGGLYYSLSAS